MRFALASTAALFVLAAAMLFSGHEGVPSPQVKTIATAPAISDQQLLAEIDDTLTNTTPEALAPIELISQDMDKSLKARNLKKEAR